MFVCGINTPLFWLVVFLLLVSTGVSTEYVLCNKEKLAWIEAKRACSVAGGTFPGFDLQGCATYPHIDFVRIPPYVKGAVMTSEQPVWAGFYLDYYSITNYFEKNAFLQAQYHDPLKWKCGKLIVTDTSVKDWENHVLGENCSRPLPSICDRSPQYTRQSVPYIQNTNRTFLEARIECVHSYLWELKSNQPVQGSITAGKEYWIGKVYRSKWCNADQQFGNRYTSFRECGAISPGKQRLVSMDCNERHQSLCTFPDKENLPKKENFSPSCNEEQTTSSTFYVQSTTLFGSQSTEALFSEIISMPSIGTISSKHLNLENGEKSSVKNGQGGLIAGVVVGALVLVVVVVVLLLLRRKLTLKEQTTSGPGNAQNPYYGVSQSKLQDKIELDGINTQQNVSRDAEAEYNYIAIRENSSNPGDDSFDFRMTAEPKEIGPSSQYSPYDHIMTAIPTSGGSTCSSNGNTKGAYDNFRNAQRDKTHQTNESFCSQSGVTVGPAMSDNVYNTTEQGSEGTYDHTGHVKALLKSGDSVYDSTQCCFSEDDYDSTVQRKKENDWNDTYSHIK